MTVNSPAPARRPRARWSTTSCRTSPYTNLSDAPPASVTLDYTFSDGNAGAQGTPNTPLDRNGRRSGVDITPREQLADAIQHRWLGRDPEAACRAARHRRDDRRPRSRPAPPREWQLCGLKPDGSPPGRCELGRRFGFDQTGAAFTVSGNALEAGGKTFATFTNFGGTLSVDFTGSGTAATSALVNDVLRHVTYTNTSGTPPHDVTLAYTFHDGSPGNGQGAGASPIAMATTSVIITQPSLQGTDSTATARATSCGATALVTPRSGQMDGGTIKQGFDMSCGQPRRRLADRGLRRLRWRRQAGHPLAGQRGNTCIWEMDGGRIKQGVDMSAISPGVGWNADGLGDFDGDGKSDILWRDADGHTALWLMDGGQISRGRPHRDQPRRWLGHRAARRLRRRRQE